MKRTTLTGVIIFAAIAASFLGSCKKDDKAVTVQPTLYDSLGGTAKVADPSNGSVMIEKGRLGIRSVIDSTIFVIAADNRINGKFTVLLAEVTSGNLSGFMELSKNLTDFVAVATGAKNYTYTGDDMVAAHDPARNPRMNGKSSNADFNAFVEDLVIGAGKNGLPANLIGSVGRLVETLRTQVVQL